LEIKRGAELKIGDSLKGKQLRKKARDNSFLEKEPKKLEGYS